MLSRLRQLLRRDSGQEGAAAVEFALILPLLILLVLGGMDLGHAFYMQHIITTASREGARYGSQYHPTSSAGSPVAPNALNPSIANYVKLAANRAWLRQPPVQRCQFNGHPRGRGIPVTPLAT